MCARLKLRVMKREKIKVFIFSQQPLFSEGIRYLLSNTEDMQILGRAKLTDTAVLLTIETMPPDVVIVDLDTSPDNGFNLALSELPDILLLHLPLEPSANLLSCLAKANHTIPTILVVEQETAQIEIRFLRLGVVD